MHRKGELELEIDSKEHREIKIRKEIEELFSKPINYSRYG